MFLWVSLGAFICWFRRHRGIRRKRSQTVLRWFRQRTLSLLGNGLIISWAIYVCSLAMWLAVQSNGVLQVLKTGCSLKDYIEHVTNLKYEKEKNSVAKSMKPESTAFPMLFNAVKGGWEIFLPTAANICVKLNWLPNPPSVGTFSELPNLAVAERPRPWCQGYLSKTGSGHKSWLG